MSVSLANSSTVFSFCSVFNVNVSFNNFSVNLLSFKIWPFDAGKNKFV